MGKLNKQALEGKAIKVLSFPFYSPARYSMRVKKPFQRGVYGTATASHVFAAAGRAAQTLAREGRFPIPE